MSELHCIRCFPDWEEAAVARSALEAAGVPVFLHNEHYLSVEPFHRVALGGFGVMVPTRDAPAADQFLKEIETRGPVEADALCPRCGRASVRRAPNILWSIVAFFYGSAFAARRAEASCSACGAVISPDQRPVAARIAIALLAVLALLWLFFPSNQLF